MVYSSVPVYLDPPNWQQEASHQQLRVSNENPPHQVLTVVPPHPATEAGVGSTISSVRPGSMVDRARLAKIAQPEVALKCPRCESTNTKFCYFNNYSLSQPRHFCKTCRRYWTRGGALRNVPVGGGCRRNKRMKRSRSKSPIRDERKNNGFPSTSNDHIIFNILAPTTHLSFLSTTPLHNFNNFTSTETEAETGVSFGGIHPLGDGNDQTDFQIGAMSLSARYADQFKLQQLQQLPFLSTLEQHHGSNLYHFEATNYNIGSKALLESGITDLSSVRVVEENKSGSQNVLNLPRNNLGVITNSQFWSDISRYTPTSTSQLL